MIEHEQYYRKGGTYELPIEIYNDLIGQIEEAQKERDDYKSRCEKAIEYIKDKGLYEEELDIFNDDINYNELDDLLNILNGSDKK